MTENEAIEELEHSVVSYEVQNKNNITCDLTQNVLDMAIQALKEIQKYRAIGTVEELKLLQLQNHLDRNESLVAGRKEGYNKAIDEFTSTLIPRLTDAIYQKDVESMTNLINDVAEQMKAENEKFIRRCC